MKETLVHITYRGPETLMALVFVELSHYKERGSISASPTYEIPTKYFDLTMSEDSKSLKVELIHMDNPSTETCELLDLVRSNAIEVEMIEIFSNTLDDKHPITNRDQYIVQLYHTKTQVLEANAFSMDSAERAYHYTEQCSIYDFYEDEDLYGCKEIWELSKEMNSFTEVKELFPKALEYFLTHLELQRTSPDV